ncbi:MAG: asparagine synthase (glutamine-hydrolyzing), partial [Pirellulaceae bacterium]|nr:asparagine synthase (glutamine-hydrolyzing) [Pirellulaceae bacterium]
MCGITGGIWTDPGVAIDASSLATMTDALRHRGPDDHGRLVSEFFHQPPYAAVPGVALGFRRLSIIDLEGGKQPIANEDNTIWVVFNGEIYNYKTLRRRLEGGGHRFQTDCDSETIVHLYEDEGEDCFRHLNGMFAIAIWDSRRRRLVLGRDRLGQKPLVYRREAKRLLFASELKSLLLAPNVPREVDPNAVDEYLTYQYVPHPNTIFRGIHKLPPGSRAVFEGDKLTIDEYWQPDLTIERQIPSSDAARELRSLLESSVQLRMQSDVPLGAFLSGGVDSSLIAALMQKHSPERIKTFCIGFPVAEYDESAHAERVANHIGSEHRRFEVKPDAVDVLPKLIWHFDEPFADSSAIPTWYVSQWTREHVTVALSGDGGDELFAGYPRYKAVRLAQLFDRAPPLRMLAASPLWRFAPASSRQKSRIRQFKRFSEALRMSPQRRYLDWISIFNESRRADLYDEQFLAQLADSDPLEFLDARYRQVNSRDVISAVSLTDLRTYLPCDLMTKVDIASMAHSLEVRQPFLDYRVVEFAASRPAKLTYRFGRGKRILQTAFRGLIPDEIWKRKKMGF